MSYSIELRMPFLDHRIIELGLSLNKEDYFDKGYTKKHNTKDNEKQITR